MTKSMTAYARSKIEVDGEQFVIEVQSLNRRHLEIHINLHKALMFNEMVVRKKIMSSITRGHITFRITPEKNESREGGSDDLALFVKAHQTLQAVATKLGPTYPVTLDALIAYMPHMKLDHSVSEEAWKDPLEKGLTQLLQELLTMKLEEGGALNRDIQKRLIIIQECAVHIELIGKDAPSRYQERLENRLCDIKKELTEEDRDRILRELILYTDKLDVSEELTRLSSHIEQLKKLLNSNKESIGKEIEFLVVEMMRETSTLAAKSQDKSIIQKTIEMKCEVEKIREQAQNIE